MPRRGARTPEDPPADSPTPCRSHRAWRTAPRPAQSDGVTRRRTTILGSVSVEPLDPAEVRIEQGADPAHHRAGIGRRLVAAAEAELAADGVWLLQVKTLGPSDPDPSYRGTRGFYAAMGFAPLEELPDLWPGNPCLILVKTLAPA